MDDFARRGRSPSASRSPQQQHISRSPSAHNAAFNPQASALGIDPSLSVSQPSLDPSSFAVPQHHLSPPHQQAFFQPSSVGALPQDLTNPGALDTSFDFIPNQDFDLSLDLNQDPAQFSGAAGMLALHPQQQQQQQQQQLHQQHLFPQNTLSPAESMHSPSSLHSGRHSRNQSLDPASAAFLGPHTNGDWSGMQFQGHRHTPSDGQFSDVSSQHSPFVEASSTFDGLGSNSPMMGTQDPAMMNNDFGMQQFTLNDNSVHSFHSPNHSAQPSPRLSPQQAYTSADSYGLNEFPGNQAPDIDLSPTSFPNMLQQQSQPPTQQQQQQQQQQQRRSPNAFDSQMSPPEINIVTAPPDTHSMMGTGQGGDGSDSLSPSDRSRNRARSCSDSNVAPGSNRDGPPVGHRRTPSLGLHPPRNTARSVSPSGGGSRLHIRRFSTPDQKPDRYWALDLANRGKEGANGEDEDQSAPFTRDVNASVASTGTETNRRAQKHPATFQCHLCPKRFTRAYNLRSHLRTHTDERPFVCTVCGKAFARQHDRKRHEGLHSGEKKFVCKGLLQSNGGTSQQTWGCGRRFARADALGRHFRSEAGRACIKPLLDEEARERRAAAMEQANQDMINGINNGNLMSQPGYDGNEFPMDSSTFTGMSLPAALLQQYPALAEIQWNAIPGPGQDDGDLGDGRSSFDASSGGEFGFDEDEDGYVSGPGTQSGANGAAASFGNNGWSSDF